MSAEPTTLEAPSSRRDLWLGALIILAITIVSYIPVMAEGGFIWDDDSYVTENRYLQRGFDGLRLMWIPKVTPQYYPVVFTTFWIENQLWGMNPRGYHVVNVLLHACNAILVWLLARRLKIPWPWLIGAVWAVHPVNVESVAWITERKNTLSALFYLLAALAYLRFDDDQANADAAAMGESWKRWLFYGTSLVLFVMALLSKSVTCSLPAALILMMLWQRKPLSIARLAPLAPFFAIGLLLALNTAHIERVHVGAEGVPFDFSIADRFIIASRALLFYPAKLLWPWPLMFIYPRWVIDDAQASQYLWLVACVLIAIIAIVLYARGRRGPALALAFFAGTIFPALGFVNVYPMIFSFVADHFQYLASLGVIALVVGLTASVLKQRQYMVLIACVILPILGGLTWIQSMTYFNAETVWRDTLSKNEAAFMPHNNLATDLLRRSEIAAEQGNMQAARAHVDEADAHLQRAIALRPHYLNALTNLSDVRRLQGRFDEGLVYAQEVLDTLLDDPDAQAMIASGKRAQSTPLSEAAWQVGRLLELLGRREEAIVQYREAVAWNPRSLQAQLELSRLLVLTGREDDAAPVYESLLQLDPTNADAMTTLANIRHKQGRDVEARDLYARAVQTAGELGRGDTVAPMMRLVRLLSTSDDPKVRDTRQAVLIMEELAQRTQRRDPAVLDVLASVLAAEGRNAEAITTADEAAALAESMQMPEVAAQIRARRDEYRAKVPLPIGPAGPAPR